MQPTSLPVTKRTRQFRAMQEVYRHNWPLYMTTALVALGAWAAVASQAVTHAAAAVVLGLAALAVWWAVVSLLVAYVVYDREGLYRGGAARFLSAAPGRWVNIHAGVDEASDELQERFPGSEGVALDVYDAGVTTEPSLQRARGARPRQVATLGCDYAALPPEDESVDAAFMLFAAHELRDPLARVLLLRQVRRILRAEGVLVLAEHLRGPWLFLAFGPHALHFYPRRTWLHDTAFAGLTVRREVRVTPFARVFVLSKTRFDDPPAAKRERLCDLLPAIF